ncbi:MAG: NAD(P)/FAD-dependent oxidoreductase [Cyanobacteria bacterium P01_G01_bin.19]
MKNNTDVLVVGAGLSGLYAARLLQQAGVSVAVLEARDRIGGRVLSQRLSDGTTIDLGAQWISPSQRRINALVEKYQLKTIITHTQGDSTVNVGASLQRNSGTIPPMSWLSKLDLLQISWRIDRNANRFPVDKPWLHPQAEQLDRLSFADWLKKNTLTDGARAYWRYVIESGLCNSSAKFSPLEVLQQVASIGGLKQLETAEYAFFPDGAQTIAQKLAEELGNCIHLQTAVRSLEYDGQLVGLHSDRGKFYGKRVIFALPPQLIAKISFPCQFARKLAQRPKELVLGKIIKNIIVYERAWWRDLGLNGIADTPKEPIQYLADVSDRAGKPGILAAFISGNDAIGQNQTDSKAYETLVFDYVDKILGKAPLSPQYFKTMDWTAEPFSCGGYASRRAIGEWINGQNALAQPCEPIHFAGTQTATEWRSYMEGALQSAERASAEVLTALDRYVEPLKTY